MPGRDALIFFGVTATTSALIFSTLGYARRPKSKNTTNSSTYDVLERSGKRIALRNPSKISWLMGLAYAALFYYSLPLLIWRYGKLLPLLFIAIPFALSLAITSVVSSDDVTKIFLGIVLNVIIRAIGGLYIVSNDSKFYRKTLLSRGWKMIGSCEATKKSAMAYSPAKSDSTYCNR